MLRPLLPLASLALAAPAAAGPDAPDGARVLALAQVGIHQRVVIRVPRMPAGRAAPAPVRCKESKGPKCVAADALAGAAIHGELVDLVLAGGTRLRAQVDRGCGPLDFYSGFYIRPAADGRVCAGRDAIRVRSGASCRIKRFRKLTVQR